MADKSQSITYGSWRAMKRRCCQTNNHNYCWYGGRGIQVCAAWIESFDQFVLDVGLRPSKTHTLDRINNNGNYEPGNVRWTTTKEQNNNKSNTKYIVFNNETKTVSDWAILLGIPRHRIYRRLRKGWSPEDALSVPVVKGRPAKARGNKRSNRNLTFRNITHSVATWATIIGMPMKTLHSRISHGWEVEEALTTPLRPGIRNISKSSLKQICADLDCEPEVSQSS